MKNLDERNEDEKISERWHFCVELGNAVFCCMIVLTTFEGLVR